VYVALLSQANSVTAESPPFGTQYFAKISVKVADFTLLEIGIMTASIAINFLFIILPPL
jgi:hypothetical protein